MGYKMAIHNSTVPCEMCGKPTLYLGTRLCNICWELERRIPESREDQQQLLQKVNNYRENQREKHSN